MRSLIYNDMADTGGEEWLMALVPALVTARYFCDVRSAQLACLRADPGAQPQRRRGWQHTGPGRAHAARAARAVRRQGKRHTPQKCMQTRPIFFEAQPLSHIPLCAPLRSQRASASPFGNA